MDAPSRGGRLMDLGLQGRVALVTGASKGIGRGIAAGLVDEGVRVAVASRSAERIAEAASAVGARGYEFDSDDLDAVPELVAAVEADLGPIDLYIANTGGPPGGPDTFGFTRAQWEAAHRTLVLSPLAFVERLLPRMRSRGFGRIVAIGSMAVREPIADLQLSNAHRPGLVAAFKVLGREVAGDGVTLNHVHPGPIATDRILRNAPSPEAAAASAAERLPARRLGRVEEVASAAVYLCSVQAAYVNGTSILVDGGLTQSVS
jgi:3-oxoacyl-[acyl-carrier protein] reductase